MTREQFESLQPGDLILWRKRYLRTVVQASGKFIIMAIRHRSWTGRASTVQDFNVVGDKAEITGKRTPLAVLKSEFWHLKRIGFTSPRKEYIREIRERRETKLRMGRKLCANIRKLPITA